MTLVTMTAELPNGSAVSKHWLVGEGLATEIAAQLGPPGGESILTATELAEMSMLMSTPVIDWTQSDL